MIYLQIITILLLLGIMAQIKRLTMRDKRLRRQLSQARESLEDSIEKEKNDGPEYQ